MNHFSHLLNETVYIKDLNDNQTGPFKTTFGTKNGVTSSTIFESDLDVEEGWKLYRVLPNGKEEYYTIVEANFSPGFHSIPANWHLKLRKDSLLSTSQKSPQPTTINIHNSQGIQIGDHNVQHLANSLQGLIEKIESSNVKASEKTEAKSLLHDLLINPIVAEVLGDAVGDLVKVLKH